jgi:uncharacterized delta-60 repeat protein
MAVPLHGAGVLDGRVVDSDRRDDVGSRSMRRLTSLLLVTSAFAAASFGALAAPGDIDGTFGTQGTVSVDAGGNDVLRALAVAPGGAITAAGGSTGVPGGAGFQIVRRLPGGAADAAFAGGRVGVEFGGDESANAVALQADGKTVVAGSATLPGGAMQMAVARLTSTGSLDAAPGGISNARAVQTGIGLGGLRLGFDDDGRKLITIGNVAEANAVRVLSDGRILVAGTGETDAAVVRLLADGTTDTSFGTGGVARVDLGLTDQAKDMVVLADGRILLAANRTNGLGLIAGSTAHLIRLLPGGAPDPAFGQGGVAVLGAGHADALVRLPDGAIVVAGRAATVPGAVVAWRTGPTGILDGGFGTNGRALVSLGGDATTGARGLAVQANGKPVLAVTRTDGVASRAYVVRLQPGGIPDSTFATNGQRLVFPTNAVGGSSQLVANAVALQADGGILVAGGRGQDLIIGRLEGDPAAGGAPGGGSGAGGGPAGAGGAPAGGTAVPRCAGRRATIVGTARKDVLRGTRRGDVIVGLGGDDVIRGLGGADVICGGAGRDVLVGGAGVDRLLGQAGRDTLRGGPGRDVLTGGAGRDLCQGGPGLDRAPACERRRGL